jgi:thiol-disulfide isomerase/thioredoxin
MKKIILCFLSVLFLSSSSFAEIRNGDPLVDLKLVLPSDQHQTVSLSSVIKGKVAVLSFWATYCCVCIKEAPYELQLVEEFKNNPNVIFVMISIDNFAQFDAWNADIKKVFKGEGNHFLNPGSYDAEAWKKYSLEGVPRYAVISSDGRYISAKAPYPSTGQLRTLIYNAIDKGNE